MERNEPAKCIWDLTAGMTQKGLKDLISLKPPPNYANK